MSSEREMGIMAAKLENIERRLESIDKKIDDMPSKYVTRDEYKSLKTQLDTQSAVKSNRWWDVLKIALTPAVAAAIGVIIAKLL